MHNTGGAMKQETGIAARKDETRLVIKKAECIEEVEAALRLRFEVFNMELNEGLPSSCINGLDRDEYDEYCDHLIVMDENRDRIVGTYRLLPGSRVESGIGYYSESEFEMSSFRRLGGEKLELGRACVHKDYRGSAVLNLMWSGIAKYIEERQVNYLFGCTSIHTINPLIVSGIYAYLKPAYLADAAFRAAPLKRVPGFLTDLTADRASIARHIPSLFMAYLRIGAHIAGEPALDEQFGVADFLTVLDRDRILERYRKRYL